MTVIHQADFAARQAELKASEAFGDILRDRGSGDT